MKDISRIIRERHSERVPFDPRHPVKKEALKQIIEAARWAPTAHNMQNFELLVVDDPVLLKKLGSIESAISEEFLRENYQQLSFSRSELLRRRVGILGTMFPPSWRDPSKFRELAHRGEPAPLNQTINGSPAVLIALFDPRKRAPASEGDFLGVISLGCVMENMWLVAQSLGVGFQVMSVFGGPPVETKVKEILGIPKELRLAYAVRLGYPVRAPAGQLRVRRDAKMVSHNNRYGSRFVAAASSAR